VKTHDKGDQDLVFYYSRERRLSRASQTVRELNDGVVRKTGLFRSLTPTRGHLFLLLSIFIICGMIIIASNAPGGKELTLGGSKLTLSIREEGGERVLTILKEIPQGGEAYTGAVDLAVSPARPEKSGSTAGDEEAPEILTRRLFFTLEEREDYRIPLSFGSSQNGKDYYVILQTENERIGRKIAFQ
jgi:hypothetical protein